MRTRRNRLSNNRTRKGAMFKTVMEHIKRNTPPELKNAANEVKKAQLHVARLFTPAGRSPMPKQVDHHELKKALDHVEQKKKKYNQELNKTQDGIELKPLNSTSMRRGGKRYKKRKSYKKK